MAENDEIQEDTQRHKNKFVPLWTLDAVTVSSSSCAQMLWHMGVCLRACIFHCGRVNACISS